MHFKNYCKPTFNEKDIGPALPLITLSIFIFLSSLPRRLQPRVHHRVLLSGFLPGAYIASKAICVLACRFPITPLPDYDYGKCDPPDGKQDEVLSRLSSLFVFWMLLSCFLNVVLLVMYFTIRSLLLTFHDLYHHTHGSLAYHLLRVKYWPAFNIPTQKSIKTLSMLELGKWVYRWVFYAESVKAMMFAVAIGCVLAESGVPKEQWDVTRAANMVIAECAGCGLSLNDAEARTV